MPNPLPAGEPRLEIQTGASHAGITVLGWDGEGTGRERRNLLRPQAMAGLRLRLHGVWREAVDLPVHCDGDSYRIAVAPDAELIWSIVAKDGGLRLGFACRGGGVAELDGLEVVFPFDPGVTPVALLPGGWNADGSCSLPAVVSAPDHGQLLLEASPPGLVRRARLAGSRREKWTDLVLELEPPRDGSGGTLAFTPHRLPMPEGLVDDGLWAQARRGWWNAWQPSAQWGDQAHAFSAPAGMLGNNVISDPASCSLWFYADQAMWTPVVAPGVSLLPTLRRTLEFWLDQRTRPSGEVVCYWDYGDFLDANAGPLIAAWDYIEAGGDDSWLRSRIVQLERIADFLAARDVDGDGLVEATQSGNRGSLQQPKRSCAWWDALNCGHKDGYTNAVIYRAWRCLAELEGRLGRLGAQARYRDLACRLKSAYAPALLNPATGWLAWWRSADGELHDYASPTLNGLAIEYGLVDPASGREILARLRARMQEVGFGRFDLGVPPMLVPVRREDYLLPDAIGCPKLEDGSDTVGHYMNGGITAGHVLHFLAAHYVVGDPQPADVILRAMLGRQADGGFQNGVRDASGEGADWTDWTGRPTGYEGYLADSFRFLQAVLLRDPALRSRIHRPLGDG